MKRFILLNPEEVSHVHDKLIGSRLACAEIEWGTAKDIEAAKAVGEAVAKKAAAKGIKEVVFDRGGYIYQGKIQALADAAREAGLQF